MTASASVPACATTCSRRRDTRERIPTGSIASHGDFRGDANRPGDASASGASDAVGAEQRRARAHRALDLAPRGRTPAPTRSPPIRAHGRRDPQRQPRDRRASPKLAEARSAAAVGTASAVAAGSTAIRAAVVDRAKHEIDERVVVPAKKKGMRIGILAVLGLTLYWPSSSRYSEEDFDSLKVYFL